MVRDRTTNDGNDRRLATQQSVNSAVKAKARVVAGGAHDVFISSVVVDELARTPDPLRRTRLLDIVRHHGLPLLPLDPGDAATLDLAARYAEQGVIPPAKREDALHVALAVRHGMDMLVTWNYRHLASVEREARIAAVNAAAGYTKPLRLITPMELAEP